MTNANEAGFGLSTTEVKRRHLLLKALLGGLATGLIAYGIIECRKSPPIYESLRFRNQTPATIATIS